MLLFLIEIIIVYYNLYKKSNNIYKINNIKVITKIVIIKKSRKFVKETHRNLCVKFYKY